MNQAWRRSPRRLFRDRSSVFAVCGLAVSGFAASGCAARSRPGGATDFGAVTADPAARAAALVGRMTLAEKVSQLQNEAPAIDRLGIPAYDWWSEALHGVARHGRATVFPQAIALAATFDEELVRRVAEAIADEARAKFAAADGRARGSGRYGGLTFFAPNVNIFRDPRWGRGQETYGEDPFLTARLGVAYVRGLQEPPGAPAKGADPTRHLRVAAVGKHFAVHSGPEVTRHRFDARVDAHDLADTYLPQFEALVREAHVSGIMAAYNRVNGQPCVTNASLLGGQLRGRWGFDGFVVGDCGAVGDVVSGHHLAVDDTHAAAAALRAGTDLDCGSTYRHLVRAVGAGLVTESEIDRAVLRLMTVRFRLGLFDPPAAPTAAAAAARSDWTPPEAHRALAREAARKALVLLDNDGTLPLGPGARRIAVVGPTADDLEVLLGNYHGEPDGPVTPLAGIRAAARARGLEVEDARGVTLAGRSTAGIAAAVKLASRADVVIAVLGLSPRLEGEEGDPEGGNPAGDRRDLNLPGQQATLLRAILDTGKPTVLVLTGGSALALPQSGRRPNAVLMAWYPGQEGGNALADVLFGDVAPSGRLPITFYRSVSDLPPFADYRMAGRTYRYFGGAPAYPFGHGRGYAPVGYRGLSIDAPAAPGAPAVVHLTIEGGGARGGDEVVQLYAAPRARRPGDPLHALVAFQRLSLGAGETRTLAIPLPARTFTRVTAGGERETVAGPWDVTVGDAAAVAASATVEIPSPPPAAGRVGDAAAATTE